MTTSSERVELPPPVPRDAKFWLRCFLFVAAFAGLPGFLLSWAFADGIRWAQAGRPIPPGLRESGTFEATALYLQGKDALLAAVRGRPGTDLFALGGSWGYPAGHGGARIALRTDARPGEPIRVDFRNVVSERDPKHPRVDTWYVVHLHSAGEIKPAQPTLPK